LEESIRRISEAGFSGVALVAVRPHAYPPDLDETRKKNLVDLLKSLNLEVSSVIHHGAVYGLSMSSPIKTVRDDAVNHMKNVIKLAKELGSKIAMILPSVTYHGESVDPNDAWKWTIEGLKSCAPLAEENDIVVAVEPCAHWDMPVIDTIEKCLKAFDEIGSKNFKLCIDTATLRALNLDIRKTMTDLKDLVATIHLHVPPTTPPDAKQALERTGFNFAELMKVLTDIGYDGYLELETYRLSVTEMDKFIRDCKAILEGML